MKFLLDDGQGQDNGKCAALAGLEGIAIGETLADLMDLSRKPNLHFFCPYQPAAEAIAGHLLHEEKINKYCFLHKSLNWLLANCSQIMGFWFRYLRSTLWFRYLRSTL